MIYENIFVPKPDGTKIQAKNGILYVYHVKSSTYKPDKKYNSEKRILIGKVEDKNSNKMNPNDNYYIYYGDQDEERLAEQPPYSDTINLGAVLAIRHVMSELKLDTIIKNTLADKDIDDKTTLNIISDLVAYFIIEETSVVQHFDSFARKTAILNNKIVDDTYLSRYLNESISETKISKFLSEWCKEAYSKRGIYVSYDSTNINTSSLGVELAEFGYAKDNDDLPQVNISYTLDKTNNTPLFFEIYKGSINDVSEFNYMVNKAKEYGITKVNLIMDRGYFSKNNILELRMNNHDFIMMIKSNLDFVYDKITEVKNQINSSKYYIPNHDVYGLTIKAKLFHGDYEDTYFHIYQDERNKVIEKTNLLQYINKLNNELDKVIGKTINAIDRYNKYFKLDFDDDNNLISYKPKYEVIDEKNNDFGYFCLISSNELTASETLDIYRKRDGIEKIFRMLKSELNYDTFRVHSDSSLINKTFIMFIAVIIRNEIHNRLFELCQKDRKSYTVNSTLRILNEIEITKNSKGIYVSKYALTAKQNKVLKALNIKESAINKATTEFNSRF